MGKHIGSWKDKFGTSRNSPKRTANDRVLVPHPRAPKGKGQGDIKGRPLT